MARNVNIQHLRGVAVNIPSLAVGELYIATDTKEVFVGTGAGNFPLSLRVYNAAGVRQINPHVVADKATIGAGGTVVVMLSGASAFTSATSYICVSVDITAKNRSPQITQTSGTSITFTGNAGDVIQFICVGY